MAINTQKFLPLAKTSTAIVKSAGSQISTEKKLKGGALVKAKQSKVNIQKFKSQEKEEKKKQEYGAIVKSLVTIDKFLKVSSESEKKTFEKDRLDKEKEESQKKEKKLETKEKPKGFNLPTISLPKFDFLDAVKRYFLFTFLGWLFTNTQQLLPRLFKILDIIKPIVSVVEFISKTLLNAFVSFIELGYNAYDKVRDTVKNLGGEGAQKTFDELSKNLNTLITTTILVAGAIVTLGEKTKKPDGPSGPKGPQPRGGLRRSPITGRPVPTTSGGRTAGRPDLRNPFRQKPQITGSGGGRAGEIDIRSPFRQKPKVTTTGGKSAGGRSAGRGFGKLALRGAPVIGPLIDFGIRTLIFKESPGRAAAGAIGAGIGQALGGALVGTIGGIVGSVVPFAGTLLGGTAGAFVGQLIGGFVGDWIGTSLYDVVASMKGKGKVEKKQDGGRISTNKKIKRVKQKRSVKITPKKPVKKAPQKTQPGKDVGGEKKIIELYSKDVDPFKRPVGGWLSILFSSEVGKRKDTTAFDTLVKNSKSLKEIPLIGRFLGAGIDAGALGQAPDKNLVKGFAEELNYFVQMQTEQQVSQSFSSIRQAISTMSEGGTVPQRTLNINKKTDISDQIEKSLEGLVNRRVSEAIKNLSKSIKNMAEKGDVKKDKEGGPQSLYGLETGGAGGVGAGGYASGEKNFVPSKEIYEYLRSKGVSDIHARGILANIQAESSFNSGAIGDNGTSGGLFQHHAERFRGMVAYAGKDWKKNWKRQVDYALREDAGKQYVNKRFRNAEEASSWFTLYFERPSNKEYKATQRLGNLKNFGPDGSWTGGKQPGVRATRPIKVSEVGFDTGLRTGPAGRIGAGTEYHIDARIHNSLPMDQKVAMLDSLAKAHIAKGRVMEFSGRGVGGLRWNPNLPYDQKVEFAKKVLDSHHTDRGEWRAFDFYSVKASAKDRWDKSAEGAEIMAPNVPGGSFQYGEDPGGYGRYLTIKDKNGVPVFMTGHGDLALPSPAKIGSIFKLKEVKTEEEISKVRAELQKSNIKVVNGNIWRKTKDGKWSTGTGKDVRIISNSEMNSMVLSSVKNILSPLEQKESVGKTGLNLGYYYRDGKYYQKGGGIFGMDKEIRVTPTENKWLKNLRVNQEKDKVRNADSFSSSNKLSNSIKNLRQGEKIVFTGVGSVQRGRNIFGFPVTKYYDPKGRNIGEKEFTKNLRGSKTLKTLKNRYSKPPQKKIDGGIIGQSKSNLPIPSRFASYENYGQKSMIAILPIETEVMVPVPMGGGGPMMFPSANLNIKDSHNAHSLSR